MNLPRNWIPEELFEEISQLLPIPCVDVMPVRRMGGNDHIGLIYRDTPHQGRRWCLVGGRLLHNEPLREAVAREIRLALGASVKVDSAVWPPFAAEYFSIPRGKAPFDPRKHAISWTFPVRILGKVHVANEALDFRWFSFSDLQAEKFIGFGQKTILLRWYKEICDG